LYILLHFLRPISAFLRKMIGRAVTARPEGRRKICAYAQGEHMTGAAAATPRRMRCRGICGARPAALKKQ